MRRALLSALVVFATITLAASGCSKRGESAAAGGNDFGNPLAPAAAAAPPDSNPNHPPHPPHPDPHPPIAAVVFVSSDSAFAGDSTATTRWQLGNDGKKPFTMPWVLTSARNWPGFPKSGSVALAGGGTQLLQVGVAVPDTAAAGGNQLHMTVTRSDGTTAAADGFVLVLAP